MMTRLLSIADWNDSIMTNYALLAVDSTLLGRFAFASIFATLIVWLWWVPTERLQGPNEEITNKVPSVTFVRYTAIAIATLQMLLYLFWG